MGRRIFISWGWILLDVLVSTLVFPLSSQSQTSQDNGSVKIRVLPPEINPFLKHRPAGDALLGGEIGCTSAQVSCSANTYSFPSGTSGYAPDPVGGYPNYGCLGQTAGHYAPGPAWYYMQVGMPGDIIIFIEQVSPSGSGLDVDFICWGPFASLTDGCTAGLTGECRPVTDPCLSNTIPGFTYPRGNIVDCSYDGAFTETCHILNAQPGEIYILLLSNYNGGPGTITFSQTGGTGVTNCDIVNNCAMVAVTASPTPCNPATNTFGISGIIEFSNPPPAGTLVITDSTAVPVVSQTFPVSSISNPVTYSLSGISCDGAVHYLTAAFSDSADCYLTQTCTAPPPACPSAVLSGGDTLCDDGLQQATLMVAFTQGFPPYSIQYSINGGTPILIDSIPGSPYTFNAQVPGTYTLTSVADSICITGGAVSGTATVVLNPLPVLSFPAFPPTCLNSPVLPLTMASPAGGSYTGTGVTGSQFNPAAAGIGVHPITYHYTDGNGCTDSAVRPVTVHGLPAITFNALPEVCFNDPAFVLTAASPAGGLYTGNGVASGMFDPGQAGSGTHLITYTYTDANGCTSNATQTLVVNTLPVISFAPVPDACPNQVAFALSFGSPPGGTWAGPGVTAGTFNPATAGVGNHPVIYSFTDLNGCTQSDTASILVHALPDVDFSGPTLPSTVCQDYPVPSRYQVLPDPVTTFTWSLPEPYSAQGTLNSVAGSPHMTDVAWTGTGAAQVRLSGITSFGCQDSRVKNVFIHPRPSVAFTRCYESVTTLNAKPFLLRGGTPTGAGGSYSVNGVPIPGALLDPSSLTSGLHVVKYSYTDANGCLADDTTTLRVLPSNAGYVCGGIPFTDPGDPDPGSNKYPTMVVTAHGRTTCWMTKNMNRGVPVAAGQNQTDNCTVEKYCPPADLTCLAAGGYYQWDELMQYNATPGWSRGVCPPGWHVPTSSEWQDLIDAMAGMTPGDGMAGAYLLDPAGFGALTAGFSYQGNQWSFTTGVPVATMFWTSTLEDGDPLTRGLNSSTLSVSRYAGIKANAFPVRCVKD